MFNAMTMMSLYVPRALEEIVKLGGNPLLEEIINSKTVPDLQGN